jgi:hypothetical protein
MRSLLLALLVMLAPALPASAQGSPVEDCDRLAAEPGTVEGVTGVAPEAIDADAATAACAAALEEQPGDARLSHQYARALERAGRLEDARRLYEWAAGDGFAPAEAALARLDATAGATATGPSSDELKQTAEEFAALSSALRRYAGALPKDPTDPLTILAEIGDDPQALFQWVKDKTRLIAYRGSLRGPRGVLRDRAGNSLDRALLLANLLRGAGQEVRLAHAALSEEQARALLPALERTVPPPPLPASSEAETMALFEAAGLDPALVKQAVSETAEEAERATRLRQERYDALLPALREAVGDTVSQADAAGLAETLAALQEHYWVQLRTSQGWRDLDSEGEVLGAVPAADTLDAAKAPEALRHGVTLRVILELQDEAGRRQEKLLEWSAYPDELIDKPITFSHMPHALISIDQVLGTTDYQARMLDALDQESAWVPMLKIVNTVEADKLFTRDGAITPADLDAFIASGQSIAALTAAVSTILEGGEAPVKKTAIPTAEWLEVEVRVPGAEPAIHRRAIFDMVGPAARATGETKAFTPEQLRDRNLRLLGQTQILITGATPSKLEVARIVARDLAVIADLSHDVLGPTGPVDPDTLPSPPRLPLALYAFASERPDAADAAATPAPTSPNVVLFHRRLSLAASAIVETSEIDIVHADAAPRRDAFQTRLAQGVSDSVQEGVQLVAVPVVRNAAAIHAEDIATGKAWSRVDPQDSARLGAAGVPADFRAWLEADLAAGNIVVAPADLAAAAAAGRLAWWRIDPRTGTALGMLPDGSGASMVERAHHYVAMIDKPACAFALLGAALSGGEGGALGAAGLALCAVAAGAGGGGAGVKLAAGVAGIAVHVFEIVHGHGGAH